ncbi:hypothetical protein P175DRAFT_0530909 [Aspergillus ochraceoroseus IBT 24754]|uniref:Uncharacterized protein n=1 Tax=Aspergillus ochraceoroseus IBT 24754 TaxID=1392256 RepID=A0A2T5LYR6_9EURO|nr:uncharacterized protein P175DRAFT_0530909 [Aspergillus ochraceoroseus IBT 24754]PTU21413.1 hypothetical protein P175DRAFT_0530909 [Aspergillus ochraceoroseus IBT 24754]
MPNDANLLSRLAAAGNLSFIIPSPPPLSPFAFAFALARPIYRPSLYLRSPPLHIIVSDRSVNRDGILSWLPKLLCRALVRRVRSCQPTDCGSFVYVHQLLRTASINLNTFYRQFIPGREREYLLSRKFRDKTGATVSSYLISVLGSAVVVVWVWLQNSPRDTKKLLSGGSSAR